MKEEKPDWYNRLKEDPASERPDRAAYRAQIEQAVFNPSQKQALNRWFWYVGVCGLMAVVLFIGWFGYRINPPHSVKPIGSTEPYLTSIRDESAKDPELSSFLAQLREVVSRRDFKALMEAVDDQVIVSLEQRKGKEEFMKVWKLGDYPEQSPIWNELEYLLGSGGFFANSSYVLPGGFYMNGTSTAQVPQESFMYVSVVKEGVPLYEKPDLKSKVVAKINNEPIQERMAEEMVTTVNQQTLRFVPVMKLDGTSGYVLSSDIRGDSDFRMHVAKGMSGVWKITFLGSVNP